MLSQSKYRVSSRLLSFLPLWIYFVFPKVATYSLYAMVLRSTEKPIQSITLLSSVSVITIFTIVYWLIDFRIPDPMQSQRVALCLAIAITIMTPFIIQDINNFPIWLILGIGSDFLMSRVGYPSHLQKILTGLKAVRGYGLLLYLWTSYDIRARYSQTLLGIFWAVIQPLSMSLVIALVFTNLQDNMSIGDVSFVSYLLTGIAFWSLFAETVSKSSTSLISQLPLLKRIYFPAEIPITMAYLEVFVDFCFNFVALLAINAIFFGIFPSIEYLFLIPLLIIQSLFIFGIICITSIASVFIRDVPQLIGIIIRTLFYLTPIIYPMSILPERILPIIYLNPMVSLIDSYRNVILFHQLPDLIDWLYPFIIGLFLFLIAYPILKHSEHLIPDYN